MEEINVSLNETKETENLANRLNLENGVNLELTPSTENSNEIIAELQPARFSAFNKILSFLSQGMTSQDTIYIRNGVLTGNKSAGIIYSNMQDLFGKNSIEIIDPANTVKLMNLIKGGDKVLFTKDTVENNYIISTVINNEPDRIITIPIPEYSKDDIINIPELQTIKSIELDPVEVEDIINAFKITGADFYILGLDNDLNLIEIELNNKKFKQKINKGKVTQKYKLFDLLMVSKPDAFKITINKDTSENLWISTISDIDIVEIFYYEKSLKFDENFDAFAF